MLTKIFPFLQKCKKIEYIVLYNILKKILPLKKNKIILASNRSKNLCGNLLWINNEIQKGEYDVKILLTDKNRIFVQYKVNYKYG